MSPEQTSDVAITATEIQGRWYLVTNVERVWTGCSWVKRSQVFPGYANEDSALADKVKANTTLSENASPRVSTCAKWSGFVAAVFAVVSVVLAVISATSKHHSRHIEACICMGLWAVVPPIYFLVEYFYFTDESEREYVKTGQEFAARIWAGVLFILAALLIHENILGE